MLYFYCCEVTIKERGKKIGSMRIDGCIETNKRLKSSQEFTKIQDSLKEMIVNNNMKNEYGVSINKNDMNFIAFNPL